MRVLLGLSIIALTLSLVLARYVRASNQGRFPSWGWAGLAIIFAGEFLLLLRVYWVSVYFTPLAWTGYLLLIDAAVFSLRGESRLSARLGEFLKVAFWSVPLWLIFEVYNLRLRNWTYVGLPENPVLQAIGYVWSFATIWPAILMTAELLEALGCFSKPWRPVRIGSATKRSLLVLGIVFLVSPVLVPVWLGQYLFGAVWVGFIMLLDPLNYWARSGSLLADLEAGQSTRIRSLLVSGFVCGIFWEFWNYWAASKWLYIFPVMQDWKIFEMPFPGYLGFPAFALECFVMYEFVGTLSRQIPRVSGCGPVI